MKLRFVLPAALASASLLGACATPGEGYRATLTKEELNSMKPEMAEHVACVAEKSGPVAWAADDVEQILDTATAQCRNKLAPFSSRLKTFNLTNAAHDRYMTAMEKSTRTSLAEIFNDRGTTTAQRY